jgi:uncharacterized membrane protein YphA (DoxX/SURF4 family)
MTAYDHTADETVLATTADDGPGRALNLTLWILQGLLAAFMAFSSSPKLIGHESAAAGFDTIGWGDWFMYLVGALELLGAIGLVVARVSGLAAIGLTLLMVGAAIFNATILSWPVYTPLILGVLFVVIAWGRHHQTKRFFAHGLKSVK